jgi:hypothetical protein
MMLACAAFKLLVSNVKRNEILCRLNISLCKAASSDSRFFYASDLRKHESKAVYGLFFATLKRRPLNNLSYAQSDGINGFHFAQNELRIRHP